jgi:hypothetical protein
MKWVAGWLRAEDTWRGAGAGLVAGGAYLAAQALDLRLLPTRTDDLAIHGRLFSADPRRWRPIGALLHLSFGAFLGALYAGWPRRRLTAHREPWRAGVLFLQAENAVLYPLLALLHRLHPAWRTGLLESYYRPLTAAQQVWRHAVFGAVLGALLGRPRR